MGIELREVAIDREDAALVEVTGAIDPFAIDPLEDLLDDLRRRGKTLIALDLAAVRYVNSTGFGLLVKHALALEEHGGGLSLLGVPKKVNVVMEMLGIAPTFAATCEHRPGAFARRATPA